MKPIGIFDSGVGGLTIFKEIRRVFPHEEIVYLGDTARLPYGTKSKQSVIHFCQENVKFLLSQDVKVIIVACNTASALAIKELRKRFTIPIIGVIKIGAKIAIEASANKKIGIIGTVATIKSKAYCKELAKLDSQVETHSKSCPMFVPLVENGYEDHQITDILVKECLQDFPQIDTLILGGQNRVKFFLFDWGQTKQTSAFQGKDFLGVELKLGSVKLVIFASEDNLTKSFYYLFAANLGSEKTMISSKNVVNIFVGNLAFF